MNLQLGLVALLLAVGMGAVLVLAQIGRRGSLRRRPALTLMVVAAALYACGYAIELTGDSVAWVLATFRVQHLAIAFAPTLVLWLAADYAPRSRLVGREVRWLAVVGSAATLAVVLTNPWHDLYHANPRMDTSGLFPVFAFDRGPWYWGFQVFSAAAVLAANGVFLRAWRSAAGTRRTQARSLFFASVVPWLGSLVNLTGAVPMSIDVMPFTLVVTSMLLYQGVVRQGMADLAPIARDLVFERMGDAAVVLDPDGRVLDLNEAAVALLGPLVDRNGVKPATLVEHHPALAQIVASTQQELDAEDISVHKTLRDERSVVTLDGRTYSCRLVELREGRRRHLGRVLVLREISRFVELEEMLREMATIDELTGLANRRHFMELAGREVERARRTGRPFTMIVFDLDRFKRVNDTFGHQVGDAVLRTVAIHATVLLRGSDLVGRYGGEEFAICLPDTDEACAARVAERLRAGIAGVAVPAGPSSVQVTISVGHCTMAGPHLPSLDTLLGHADAAQYEAKAKGGNQVAAHRPDREAGRLGPQAVRVEDARGAAPITSAAPDAHLI
jgi:diguanylate cyclase (GGDEF)-like protein